MIHHFETTQIVQAGMDRAWAFFSDPRNLPKLTPPELNFTVRSTLPERVYRGMMIEYRVHPLFGIPLRWLTEITHVEPGEMFVDEQRIGPYRIWHHEHHFKALDADRVKMTDRVTYVLPFGLLGNLVHPFLVKPKVEAIFAFRKKAVDTLFPNNSAIAGKA